MRGWILFIAGLLCSVAVLVYFHKIPANALAMWSQPGAAATSPDTLPAANVLIPGEEPGMEDGLKSPPASGDCYLSVAVEVPNKYGTVTYQRGTSLHYMESCGERWAVRKGIDQFTITPHMVTDSLASALAPRLPARSSAAQTATAAAPAE
ncbi:MAG TPA: hypothetical protein VHY22_05680 [Chthoniobacteraceae bacterium]|jgi:hypothetical protein|nr:hypothetical protein [Chthoniobacteraceae bacterium]